MMMRIIIKALKNYARLEGYSALNNAYRRLSKITKWCKSDTMAEVDITLFEK